MSKVVTLVSDIFATVTKDTDFELVDVEFVKEGRSWFLRVFADTPDGIDLDTCAWLSEKISDALDAVEPDPIPQEYFLEVSSPGAERPLKKEEDIQQAIGKYIHASFYQALDGEKFIEGTLEQVDSENIVLRVKNKTRFKEVTIARQNIAKLRLAIEF